MKLQLANILKKKINTETFFSLLTHSYVQQIQQASNLNYKISILWILYSSSSMFFHDVKCSLWRRPDGNLLQFVRQYFLNSNSVYWNLSIHDHTIVTSLSDHPTSFQSIKISSFSYKPTTCFLTLFRLILLTKSKFKIRNQKMFMEKFYSCLKHFHQSDTGQCAFCTYGIVIVCTTLDYPYHSIVTSITCD